MSDAPRVGRSHRAVMLPSLLWLTLFFLLPAALVLTVAFKPPDPYGGIAPGWTFDTLKTLGGPGAGTILTRTLALSLATTAICLALGLPAAYAIARAPGRWRNALLLAVIVPFWTSFLVRVFAWKSLLHPDGPVKAVLVTLHLVAPETQLLYGPGAVLLVLVSTELPFAILPLYAAAEKFDFRLLEAAGDLGAPPLRAVGEVFLPGIRRGLWTATLVTLIPCLGTYVVPDLVGGATSEMIGNKIAQRVFVDRNLPTASALSLLLLLAVLMPAIAVFSTQRERSMPPGAKS